MNAESRLLLDALRCGVAGAELPPLPEVDWKKLAQLAGRHMLLPLLYDGLHRSPEAWKQVPEEVQTYLQRHFMRAVYQDTQFAHVRRQLTQKLKERSVCHIFLKGAVLKQDYPVPALRTMCDMDVLVRTEDYGKIAEIAAELGGRSGHSDGNHRNYSFPGGVTVEFHPNLLHHGTPVGCEINPGWEYAVPVGEDGSMTLSEEGIYLNTLCHLANHFVSGGVGVRFVLDVWVSRHLRRQQPDRGFVEAELQKMGLLEFARNIETLAEVWFGGDSSQLPEGLEEYILTSGSHGITNRAMLNAVVLSPGGNQASALWKKAFYSRSELEDRFPWCKGKPWLLPAAWLTRAFRAVTRHGGKILQWGRGTGQVTREEVERQRQLLRRFGIDPGRNS